MRLIAAVRADLAFQWKQGFFLVYVIQLDVSEYCLYCRIHGSRLQLPL
jgi:hypothetical protein